MRRRLAQIHEAQQKVLGRLTAQSSSVERERETRDRLHADSELRAREATAGVGERRSHRGGARARRLLVAGRSPDPDAPHCPLSPQARSLSCASPSSRRTRRVRAHACCLRVCCVCWWGGCRMREGGRTRRARARESVGGRTRTRVCVGGSDVVRERCGTRRARACVCGLGGRSSKGWVGRDACLSGGGCTSGRDEARREGRARDRSVVRERGGSASAALIERRRRRRETPRCNAAAAAAAGCCSLPPPPPPSCVAMLSPALRALSRPRPAPRQAAATRLQGSFGVAHQHLSDQLKRQDEARQTGTSGGGGWSGGRGRKGVVPRARRYLLAGWMRDTASSRGRCVTGDRATTPPKLAHTAGVETASEDGAGARGGEGRSLRGRVALSHNDTVLSARRASAADPHRSAPLPLAPRLAPPPAAVFGLLFGLVRCVLVHRRAQALVDAHPDGARGGRGGGRRRGAARRARARRRLGARTGRGRDGRGRRAHLGRRPRLHGGASSVARRMSRRAARRRSRLACCVARRIACRASYVASRGARLSGSLASLGRHEGALRASRGGAVRFARRGARLSGSLSSSKKPTETSTPRRHAEACRASRGAACAR